MFDQTIKLNKANATKDKDGNVTDWLPALRAAATEIKGINAYVGKMGINPETGEDFFPRPIPCNPDCDKAEGMLGDNTPPDMYGRLVVRLPFTYIDFSMMPITTFTVVGGKPEMTAVIA